MVTRHWTYYRVSRLDNKEDDTFELTFRISMIEGI